MTITLGKSLVDNKELSKEKIPIEGTILLTPEQLKELKKQMKEEFLEKRENYKVGKRVYLTRAEMTKVDLLAGGKSFSAFVRSIVLQFLEENERKKKKK